MDMRACVHCDDGSIPILENDEFDSTIVCAPCSRRLPAALLKAAVDPFDYSMQLRTGDMIRFEQASIFGDWVRLHGVKEWDHVEPEYPAYTFDRGLDVRIADIVWCCDAPQGS